MDLPPEQLRSIVSAYRLSQLVHAMTSLGVADALSAVEMVMPEGVPPSPRGLADLQALVVYGGKDRTESEWAELLAEAGFAAPWFHAADFPYSIVDATLR